MQVSTRSSVVYAMTVAALGASLAGCGGSSSGGGGTTSSAALTRAQIVAKADAICAAEAAAGEKIEPPADIQNAEQAAAYFDQVDPLASSTTAKLAALKPDSEVAADWNAFIGLRTQLSTILHTVREKADAKDRSGLTDLQSSQDLGTQVEAAATKVGTKACASE